MNRTIRSIMPVLVLLILTSSAFSMTADHSKFEALQRKFKTGPEVTKACISCHTEAPAQIHANIHWLWLCPSALLEGKKVGKSQVINNFCIAMPSNEPRCTSCHIGFGWKDSSFDFTSDENIDCIVCHDQSDTYRKFPSAAGHPVYKPTEFGGKIWYPPDLTMIAQNVGSPTREACGQCHFYGGGGEGVKHADLDNSLMDPDWELDVHMDKEGLNYTCQDCHTTIDHHISGRCYAAPASEEQLFSFPLKDPNRIYCQSCHGNEPHTQQTKLNHHADKVACQTCHIPIAAKKKATKYWWDWSKAGQMDENGKPFTRKDEDGNAVYDSRKGEFRWGIRVKPEYFWFNGSAGFTLIGDTINPDEIVKINELRGSYHDPKSRIWPAKVHRGKQPYDAKSNTMVVPKLFGPKGSGAYWSDFDWTKAVQTGMDYVKTPFSGEVGFVETEMWWPITHMVSPANEALRCNDCHSTNGKLQNLAGFYMPNRDRFSILDTLGTIIIILSFAGVLFHGILRIVVNRKSKSGKGK